MPITVARERKTPTDMPLLNSKGAPKKFYGDFDEVDEFLMDYEQCAAQCNLNDQKQKCYLIRRYCSSEVKEVLDGLTSYYGNSWAKFKKEFELYFDAARSRRKYRESDLQAFAEDSRTESIQSLTDFKRYMRRFAAIGGWLHRMKKITGEQHRKYFWAGLPKKFRNSAERRILSMDPDWEIATPFTIEMITTAANHLLDPERFDADVLEEEGDMRGTWPEEVRSTRRIKRDRERDRDRSDRIGKKKTVTYRDEWRDNSESEDETQWSRKSVYKEEDKSSVKRSALKRDSGRTSEEDEVPRTTRRSRRRVRSPAEREDSHSRTREVELEEQQAAKQDELTVVLKRMEKLSVDDPGYVLLYAKAISLEPLIQPVLRVPRPIAAPAPPPAPERAPWAPRPPMPPRAPMPMPAQSSRSSAGVYAIGPQQMGGSAPQTGYSGTYPNNIVRARNVEDSRTAHRLLDASAAKIPVIRSAIARRLTTY
jgi:hypothetical protein